MRVCTVRTGIICYQTLNTNGLCYYARGGYGCGYTIREIRRKCGAVTIDLNRITECSIRRRFNDVRRHIGAVDIRGNIRKVTCKVGCGRGGHVKCGACGIIERIRRCCSCVGGS